MKTEKWVQCTEELALNPERVKAWRNKDKVNIRFIAYDKENGIWPIVVRGVDGVLDEYKIHAVECLIEVPIHERFITFNKGDDDYGSLYNSLEEAKELKKWDCAHIVKLTYDGEDFKAECVWTKESNS